MRRHQRHKDRHCQPRHFTGNPNVAWLTIDGVNGPPSGDSDNLPGDRSQIWIIGTRDQVLHTINEFYVKRIANDRAKFTPIIPAPFAPGKYMSVLER